MTPAGAGTRNEGAADPPSRADPETCDEARVLVWNGLVARADPAGGPSLLERDDVERAPVVTRRTGHSC
jgi:hypothetical protein